ncbi:MAG: FAD/NAD(P)-binding oxidoreductase [Pseudomonadota bacterium]
MQISRRKFLEWIALAGTGSLLPGMGVAADRLEVKALDELLRVNLPRPGLVPGETGAVGRVLVIGGGMAGATVAKYLRLWGGARVEVTLVERNAQYTSCIMSNLVLTGQLGMSSLKFDYAALARNYGVKIEIGDVVQVDPIGHRVMLAGGKYLDYDRLVIAPGIDFLTIPGLESATAQDAVPHAWKAGAQTLRLKDQIQSMPKGGSFVLTIPKAPYRCPPGPYERACLVADYLKKSKPGSKVIVLDANPQITAEPENFSRAFNETHAGVVEYHSGVGLQGIDASTRTLHTSLGTLRANVINAIPPQKAGSLVINAGLANVGGLWAGVDVLSYESTAARDIHVIGDAAATTQPKAGHIANAEAKVCAGAIVRLLRGESPDPAPVTNSACFTPITMETASWLTVVFGYDPLTRTMKPVGGKASEAHAPSSEHFKDMIKWFNNLKVDTFY